jgi:hypothetical protein
MGRKPRVDRSPEEKWQIVQEGIKSGNVSETCRRHGITQAGIRGNLFLSARRLGPYLSMDRRWQSSEASNKNP